MSLGHASWLDRGQFPPMPRKRERDQGIMADPIRLIREVAAEWFGVPLIGVIEIDIYDCERIIVEIAAAKIVASLASQRGYLLTKAAAEHRAEFLLWMYSERAGARDRDVVRVIRSGAAYNDLPTGALFVAAGQDGQPTLYRKRRG